MATYRLIGGPFEGESRAIPDNLNRLSLPISRPPRIVPPGEWPPQHSFNYADYSLRRFNFNDAEGRPIRQIEVLVYAGMSDDEACQFLNENA